MNQDLVITGVGAVGPFGHTAEALWDALVAPETTLTPENLDADGRGAGMVKDFDVTNHVKNRRIKRAPKISQFAIAAAAEAIAQAKLGEMVV